MRSACVPVISAVVQTGSRTFRSTSGTTLTVPAASAPRARLPTTAGSATAPAAPAVLLINSRRDISAPGTVRWSCRISATRSLRAATMADGRLWTKRQEAASTGARRLDVRLRQPTRPQGDKPASRISDAGFSPALAPKGPFARPSKRSANAAASSDILNSTETSMPQSASRQEKVVGSKRCSSSHIRIADICRERSPGCMRISTRYMFDSRLFLRVITIAPRICVGVTL